MLIIKTGGLVHNTSPLYGLVRLNIHGLTPQEGMCLRQILVTQVAKEQPYCDANTLPVDCYIGHYD